MESKYITTIVAVIAVIAIALSGVALGVALTKNNNELNEAKFTVYIGTNAETYGEAVETMNDITLASSEQFDNGYSAFVVTGSTFEDERGQVKNAFSIVIMYGMVKDENALKSFLTYIQENMSDRTDVILVEKSNAAYYLYIPDA